MTHLFRTFWTKSTATVLLDSVLSEVFFGRVILVRFLKILFNLQGGKKANAWNTEKGKLE